MQSFDQIPRVPARRILGMILGTGASRYEMRELHAWQYRELGAVVRMGGGRFTSVNLFGPDDLRVERVAR